VVVVLFSLSVHVLCKWVIFFKVHFARVLFCLLRAAIVILCAPAFATLDLGVGASLRTYPISGTLQAEGGWNKLFWGDVASPFYGYLRARAAWDTAVTYNSLDGALEFFPIAFLGVRAGGEAIQNDSDYSAFDCTQYACTGRFYRTYLEPELSLGYGPVFTQFRWRRERWSEGHSARGDFVDPTSGVVLKANGDSQTVYYMVAGAKVSPTSSVVALARYAESDEREQISRLIALAGRYQGEEYSVLVGLGTFDSEIKSRGLTVLASVRWVMARSLALK